MTTGKLARYTRHVQVRVTNEQYKGIRMLAAQHGVTTQDLFEGIINQLLGRKESREIAGLAGFKDEAAGRVAQFMALAPPPMRQAVDAIVASWEATKAQAR